MRDAPKQQLDPTSYAPFAATFTAALALLPVAVRAAAVRGRGNGSTRLGALDVLQLSVATYAASQIIVKEKVGRVIREPILGGDDEPEIDVIGDVGSAPEPVHEVVRSGPWEAFRDLLQCTRCVGAWIATGLTALRLLAPAHGRVVLHVLTAVGANNFLQAAFSGVRAKVNLLEEEESGDDGTARPAIVSAPASVGEGDAGEQAGGTPGTGFIRITGGH